MIAPLFLAVAIPIAIPRLASLCARRALPLAAGLCFAWSLSLFHLAWVSCLMGGLAGGHHVVDLSPRRIRD
jgi:hypothetical protein